MLDDLFAFPIIMVDGENEEKKEELGNLIGHAQEMDIIIGEAECPYFDLIAISDRWQPNEISLKKAIDGTFDACFVVFGNSGSYLVPWTKKKFKKEYQKFVEGRPKEEAKFVALTPEVLKQFVKNEEDKPEEGE